MNFHWLSIYKHRLLAAVSAVAGAAAFVADLIPILPPGKVTATISVLAAAVMRWEHARNPPRPAKETP